MKTLIVIFSLFLSNYIFACSCMPVNLTERISTSDFIAKAKIKKISIDKNDKYLHNIEIEIIDLYKGMAIKKLKIYSAQMTSCPFFTPQKTTWLIFASKDKDGILKFGYCSGSLNIEKNLNSVQRKINVLKYLKAEKINLNSKNNIAFVINSDFLKKFNGLTEPINNFALYEVHINKDLSIKSVYAIKEFQSSQINSEIIDILKSKSKVYAKNRELTILEEEKIIIPLFYYPKENNERSFISPYDL